MYTYNGHDILKVTDENMFDKFLYIFFLIFRLHNECFISLNHLLEIVLLLFVIMCTTCININLRVLLTARRLKINFAM